MYARLAICWTAGCLLLVAALGCGARTGLSVVDAGTAPAPMPACMDVEVPGMPGVVPRVDLLFVIDNSFSMQEEQGSLLVQLPGLVRAITTGDPTPGRAGDEFPPVTDLHVGVVTTDMGAELGTVRSCPTEFGDDGLFSTPQLSRVMARCFGLPSFLSYSTDTNSERFSEQARCLAQVTTTGCSVEQPLEAQLKALWPPPGEDADPPGEPGEQVPFARGTSGHGQTEHAGFLRDDSVLVLVVFTDEDDCSVRDLSAFHPDAPAYAGVDFNIRCASAAVGGTQDRMAMPINRYVEGFLALRRGRPTRLVFAAIVGVPLLTGGTGVEELDALLAEPLMQEELDPGEPGRACSGQIDCIGNRIALRCERGLCVPAVPRVRPACEVAGRGFAAPPRRIVTVARDLAAAGVPAVVQSICQEDLGGAATQVLRQIGAALDTVCVPTE